MTPSFLLGDESPGFLRVSWDVCSNLDDSRLKAYCQGPFKDIQNSSLEKGIFLYTLQGTNISPQKWHFEDDFPIPQVGYVSFLEGNSL